MNNLNKGKNKVSKNRVITTDERYELIRGCLLRWYLLLVTKVILLIASIWMIYTMWPLHNAPNFLGFIFFLCFVVAIELGALSVVHLLQGEPEQTIDSYFFGHGNMPVHWLQLFPGKGMRLAHREVRRYRRQKRLQEKEHEEKR